MEKASARMGEQDHFVRFEQFIHRFVRAVHKKLPELRIQTEMVYAREGLFACVVMRKYHKRYADEELFCGEYVMERYKEFKEGRSFKKIVNEAEKYLKRVFKY